MKKWLWLKRTLALAGCLLAVSVAAADTETVPTVQAAQNECARKQADGCFQLGQFYFDGQGVPRDKALAAQWYEKACLLGMDKGCADAGAVYFRHLLQPEKAVALLQKPCRNQKTLSCSALNHIGRAYMTGDGVARDTARAAAIFQTACDSKNMPGCFNLGLAYVNGDGVGRDFRKAQQYFREACDNGFGRACYDLGVMYLHGEGVEQDFRQAKTLFGRACSQGYGHACDGYRDLGKNGY